MPPPVGLGACQSGKPAMLQLQYLQYQTYIAHLEETDAGVIACRSYYNAKCKAQWKVKVHSQNDANKNENMTMDIDNI